MLPVVVVVVVGGANDDDLEDDDDAAAALSGSRFILLYCLLELERNRNLEYPVF